MKKSGKFFAGLAFVVIWILFPPQIVDAQSGIAEIGEKVWSLFDQEGDSQEKPSRNSPKKDKAHLETDTKDGTTTQAEAEKSAQKDPESAEGWARQIWNFPILKTGDAWIRLNQLVWALGVLVVGGLLASLLSRLLQRFIRRRKRIDQNAAIVIQKTSFYFMFLLVLILAVQVADVPLAFLTLVITAVAIGASIGAKNTIYDYLSGLILALEKPVRVGDCVEVGEQRGFVTEIAGRFTIIRRFDGIDVLVPNSKLLENSVINWTLRDIKLRGDIEVGVLYSSPARKVAQLIEQAIKENNEVLQNPPPGVRLWEFGDSSLIFWGWFWADAENPLDIWRIQSEVRFRVLELFRENQITIAFPQRDVHLDTRETLNLQVDRMEREKENDKNITSSGSRNHSKDKPKTSQETKERADDKQTEEELKGDQKE